MCHHCSSQIALREESFDFFASAAVPITPRFRQLLNHFIEILTPVTNPVIYGPADKIVITSALIDILRSVVKDPACLHAVIADAASHQAGVRKENNQVEEHKLAQEEADTHRSKAISLVRARLQYQHGSFSTSTIITVRHLGVMAIKQGEEEFVAHHDGLAEMVKLSGGIDALPRTAAYHVSKAEAQMAWHRQRTPLLPPFKSRFYDADCWDEEAGMLLDQFERPCEDHHLWTSLCPQLFEVACELQHLTRLVETYSRTPRLVTALMREFAEDTYAKVQYNIVSFPFPCPGACDTPEYHRQDALRVAALIYLNTAIRVKPYDKFLQTLITRLSGSLQKSNVEELWVPHQSVLLWVMFLGYHACRGKAEQECHC
ncbi:hypothetical protein EDD36DRAFT_416399 [Exophiala viscosa]|uniref:Uncharacterized protein n=1 Tax=Exophiala viscosa TaxID=2486360 RepID=A0AAN6E0M8_9EURO|nr:hypothetical protein EDD36DRAFT_416399 [Exophiala viscosa]